MSKSHVEELQLLYAAIMKDATCNYPTLGGEFTRDLARLLRLSKERGIHLFVVDLPSVGKHLDRCLSNGEYTLSGLPLTKRYSNRVVIPKLFRGLYLLIFEKSGRLKEDCDVEAVLFLRQLLYAAKTTTLPCGSEKVSREIAKFIAIDSDLPDPDGIWKASFASNAELHAAHPGFLDSPLYRPRLDTLDDATRRRLSAFLTNLDLVSSIVTSTLGPYRFRDWRFRHGPGAISEVTKPTNKYSWFSWSDRLESVFPIADCGYHNYSSWADNVDLDNDGVEPSSRLVAVPKTFSKPRLIACEPASHQFCQQNIWHYFRVGAERSWISEFVQYNDQTLNQRLCTKGSRDGSSATVDLSSASDRVTCHVVGTAFRSNPGLVQALRASRTRLVSQKLATNLPDLIELKKFSTMGSACTFPVQSMIFLMITLACVLSERKRRVTPGAIRRLIGEVAVYGDDIVVPADSRELLFEALDFLDFKVNADKTYWNGNFRESCGVDSFRGVNVTPAMWKAPLSNDPESVASTVDVRNNFHRRFLMHTASYLASTIPRKYHFPTVKIDSGVSGLKAFYNPGRPDFKSRWNQDYQRAEYLVPMLIASVKKTSAADDSALFQYFTEEPPPYIKWRNGFTQRPKTRIRLRWVPSRAFDDVPDVNAG